MSEEQDQEATQIAEGGDIFGEDDNVGEEGGDPSSGQQRSALELMEDDDEDNFIVKSGKKRQRNDGDNDDTDEGKYDDLLADSDDEKVADAKMKARARKDEDNDDEDDEDFEESDDDDDEGKRKKKAKKARKEKKEKKEKKGRRYGVERFFDEEAEDADEDDEEVDDEADRAGEEVLREEQVEAERLIDQRHEMNRQRMNMSAQEMAAEYERKAQEERRRKQLSGSYIQGEGVLGRIKSNAVMQQSLLPTINDKIFRVRCATGKEQQLVRSILIKCIDSKARGVPLGIKSVFCTSTQGVIYIEAVAEPFAKEVIQKLYGIFHPTFKKVPVQEMTSLMTVTVKKKPLRVGQLVRMKRGVLKGDLVQIQDVMEGGSKVFVKAVPRPDYSKAGGTKGSVRPPQRLLNIEEARNTGDCQRKRCPADRTTATYDFWSNEYYKDGFMFKEVNVSTYINSEDVKPRLEELQLFRLHDEKKKSYNEYDEEISEEDDDDDDKEEAGVKNTQSIVSELAKQLQEYGDDGQAAAPYVVGDLVQITGGELRNLVARITAVDEISRTAQVSPLSNALGGGLLSVEMGLLVKYIEMGSHVKVCSGQFMGQTGRVVSVKRSDGGHVAAVLTDGVNSEIMCNISQLQISDEVATGKDNLNGYELYDLVQLNDNETGVVIYVGREKLRILTHLDVTKEVLPLEIQAKRNFMSEKAQSYDSAQAIVSVGDVVSVTHGAHLGTSGTVKHVSKGHLFLHSNSHLKNSGMFVARARNCSVAGAKTQILALGPTRGQAAGGKKVSDILPSGRSNKLNQHASVGKTIRILRGQFKGLLAQVIDATQSHYLVELLAKLKRVNIPIDITVIVGDKQGSLHNTATREPNAFFPATPSLGMDTPSYAGSETPSHIGSETPLYGAGDSTPTGQRTPAYQYMHDDDDLPASSTTATYKDWVENVVVVIKAGPNSSRIAVIQQRPSSDGKIVVSIIGHDNRLETGTLALHYSDLALHVVQKDMSVVVLSGADRGLVGVHGGTSGGNVVVKTAEGKNIFYVRENCGALFKPVQ